MQKPQVLHPNHVMRMRSVLRSARSPVAGLPHPMIVPQTDPQSFGQDDQMIPAKSGEYIIPEPVVKRKGTQFFDNLVKNTLKEVLPPSQTEEGGTGTQETGYARGGEVRDPSAEPGAFTWGNPLAASGSGNFEPGVLSEPSFGTPSTTAFGHNPDQFQPSNIWGKNWDGGIRDYVDNNQANMFFNKLSGFGTSPSFGPSSFGPTMDPTFWVNYPSVGNVPMAVPISGWQDPGTGVSSQAYHAFLSHHEYS